VFATLEIQGFVNISRTQLDFYMIFSWWKTTAAAANFHFSQATYVSASMGLNFVIPNKRPGLEVVIDNVSFLPATPGQAGG